MIPSRREILSHQVESTLRNAKNSFNSVIYSPRRAVQGALLAVFVTAGVSAAVSAPEVHADSRSAVGTADQSNNLLNLAACFGSPRIGAFESKMVAKHVREYVEVDPATQQLRNVTAEVVKGETPFEQLNPDGSVYATIQGAPAAFIDDRISFVNKDNTGVQDGINRGRFAVGQVAADGYWLEGDPKNPQNVGPEIKFTAAKPDDGRYVTVKDDCGIEQDVPAKEITKSRIIGDKEVAVENASQLLAWWCRFTDKFRWTIPVRRSKQEEVVIPPAVEPTPSIWQDNPAPSQTHYVPYNR